MSKVIIALDVASAGEAMRIVDVLGDAADFFKVGLELYKTAGPSLVSDLIERDKRVFLDLKLHDIPNTVAGAVRAASDLGVDLLTVHAGGGQAMLESARDAVVGDLRVLAVTLLTSLGRDDLKATWGREIGSVGRSDDAKFVDDSLREEIYVLERLEERPKQSVGQIHFTFHSVGEFNKQTVCRQRLDVDNTVHWATFSFKWSDGIQRLVFVGQLPILAKFVPVLSGPFQDQRQRAARKLSCRNFQRFDTDLCGRISIVCVEMRRWMVVVVHSYGDAKESADRGHYQDPLRCRTEYVRRA